MRQAAVVRPYKIKFLACCPAGGARIAVVITETHPGRLLTGTAPPLEPLMRPDTNGLIPGPLYRNSPWSPDARSCPLQVLIFSGICVEQPERALELLSGS